MSSSDGHAHNPKSRPPASTRSRSRTTPPVSRYGLFLGTEVLLFAGLFLGYTVYRHFYHDAFHHYWRRAEYQAGHDQHPRADHQQLVGRAGLRRVKAGRTKQALVMLVVTVIFACGFLVIKYLEYSHKFEVGSSPGKWFRAEELMKYPGANLVLHDLLPDDRPARVPRHRRDDRAGLGAEGHRKGKYTAAYFVPVELGALYWHLVDLVWIFLFPLLYLI